MDIDLKGKTALVCGASKGIGRATAMELASLGATVVVLARREDALVQVCASLPTPKQQQHLYVAADMNDSALLQQKLSSLLVQVKSIHILVNNSGGPPAGNVSDAPHSAFEAAFRQHVLAGHTLLQSVLPGMKQSGYGRIINVLSTSVKVPLKGLGVSNTIRAAVANWAKTLSVELAPFGITVNNVLPGATDTDRLHDIFAGKAQKAGLSKEAIMKEEAAHIPAGRFARAEELAQAIAFLASPAAAYINGVNLPVDGGRTGCL